ncbi:voltage-dependent calcium channel gamma-like subunit [Ornithorhynchus anatinus]|uniref:Transmembrane protein 37 n=1 Tax=Ornithorhynchus anatinus TaxID=9258 RepID=A0A6I8MXF5_ORNAN|nr:voltage-dependent calcium channel gamma-like subunit [Ornithorhynchus anatinus]
MASLPLQARRLLGRQTRRQQRPSFLESWVRALVTLCSALTVVLSSVSVCDGRWVFLRGQRLLGLWPACPAGPGPLCVPGAGSAGPPPALLGSLAVAVAILGLALLMAAQVCGEARARGRWALGCGLVLSASVPSAAGLLVFAAPVLEARARFTLTFWCQVTASSLFLLNGLSGLYVHRLTRPRPATR